MSKQDEGAVWWPERGYFTATPEQMERLITLGAKQESERIIKLLERLWEKTQGTDIPAVVVLPDAIALIKGENK